MEQLEEHTDEFQVVEEQGDLDVRHWEAAMAAALATTRHQYN